MVSESFHIITESLGLCAGIYLLTKKDPTLKIIGMSTFIVDLFALLSWSKK